MNCNEIQLDISKLLDGMLAKELTPAVFAHLAGCQDCQDFFSSTVHIQRAMRAAPPVPMPERYEAIVPGVRGTHRRFEADRGPVAPGAVYRPVRVRASTVALWMLMLFLGALAFSTQIELQPTSEYTATPSLDSGVLNE